MTTGTSMANATKDSFTMIRRDLRHTLRNPSAVVVSLLVPTLILLLFVGVFGDALAAGSGGLPRGGSYIDYLVPGVVLMAVGYGSSTTALAVNTDATKGIIARFRTMAIAHTSVLTGHVVGALLRILLSVALLFAVALLFGYRPDADLTGWLASLGVIALAVFALSWLAVAVGLVARTPETTTPFLLVVQILPFVSSAFVPTDAMSPAVRWFAEHEPFTPVINTLRAAQSGTPIGGDGLAAVAWCAGLAVVGFVWARWLFSRAADR
jgi:ABC-2 type transport system permease protein